jgi:hypothetical protein
MHVPELVSLCSRELAKQLRNMNNEDRYLKLQSIPKHLHCYIKAFPLNYIVWACGESILNHYFIKYYLEHKEQRRHIKEAYESDAKYGITRIKPVLRKCSNYYCDDSVYGPMILECSDNLRHSLCYNCDKYRIKMGPWVILKRKLKTKARL